MTPRGNLYDAVSERIGDRLIKLKGQLDNQVLDQDLDTEGYDCNYKQDSQKEYLSYKGSGIVPSDLMGFAARGLFMNQKKLKQYGEGVRPLTLRAWNSFWNNDARGVASISILSWAT